MVAAVWVWPRLRKPKVWFGLFSVTLIGATIWLGMDLHEFVDTQGTSEKAGVRLLFTLLSATGIPVVPTAMGSLMAGLISWRCVKAARSASTKTVVCGDFVAKSDAELNDTGTNR